MANDTPFVELSSPPRDANQPLSEADKRGVDFNGEYLKATGYRDHINTMDAGKKRLLDMLKGSQAAADSLQRKTQALTDSAPPYIDSP